MNLIEELAEMTLQRPLADVAAECDYVFTDNTAKWPGTFDADPFRKALDTCRETLKVCMAIFDRYYIKITPGPNCMHAVHLYHEWRKQKGNETSV